MTKKVLVTFSDVIWNIIKKNIKIGDTDADTVKTIVIDYLSDKGYLLGARMTDEISREFATHEIMIAALAQELSSKGFIKFEDWENKVKAQVE